MNKYLISVIGPTGIGKTALAIKLAQYFNTEIISADSRQFYKEMQIGTAAPTKTELEQAKHHFIHHKSIEDQYSVGDYEREAIALLDTLFKTHQKVVMVGGSGLFVNAVTNGLDNFPDVDGAIRQQLNDDLENKGLPYLQEQLKALDEESYKTIAIDNPRRVIRALEISIGTGKPYSSFLKKKETNRDFKTITIGLHAERKVIYERINQRVDIMMQQGLLEEVRQLISKQNLNALNTVGYKELFEYFNGNILLDEAVAEIKKNSRRYAKRQLTWFKRQPDVFWFDFKTDFNQIASTVKENIKQHETP